MNPAPFPIVHVTAINPVLTFYQGVFGGTVSYRFPEDGEPVYLTVRIGTGQIALGLGTGPAMYGETPLPATGHAVDICLYVADLDSVLAAVPGAGGSVAVPAQDTPWGERVAYLRDPQGTMLLVIQGDQG
jgi:predicted enzyme related to lactoylglutathione lyase